MQTGCCIFRWITSTNVWTLRIVIMRLGTCLRDWLFQWLFLGVVLPAERVCKSNIAHKWLHIVMKNRSWLQGSRCLLISLFLHFGGSEISGSETIPFAQGKIGFRGCKQSVIIYFYFNLSFSSLLFILFLVVGPSVWSECQVNL